MFDIPKTPDGYITEDAFLLIVDNYYQAGVNNQEISDEERQAEFCGRLTYLCYQQGNYIMRDTIPKNREVSITEKMYESFRASINRYDLARDYLYGTYNVELHPLMMLIMIRSFFDKKSKNPFDQYMSDAFNRLINSMEQDLKDLFETNEIVKEEDVTPKENLDDHTIKEFFASFEELKTFYRNRDTYNTDEERKIHDRIMTLYYSMIKRKDE